MTKSEAQEVCELVGERMRDCLSFLDDALAEATERRATFLRLWDAGDFAGLRDEGFLSARLVATYEAACDTLAG